MIAKQKRTRLNGHTVNSMVIFSSPEFCRDTAAFIRQDIEETQSYNKFAWLKGSLQFLSAPPPITIRLESIYTLSCSVEK